MPSFNMTGVLKRRGNLDTQRDSRHQTCAHAEERPREDRGVRRPQRSEKPSLPTPDLGPPAS